MDGLARLKQAGLQPTFVALESRYRIAKMGTSGVREVREVYNQKHYLEQFIQGIADHFLTLPAEDLESGKWTILLGGDPRLGNAERIRMAARIFAASGFTVLTASHNGVSSTPAMSHAIRHTNAVAGIIFTASHNPFTDVGIKVNIHDGSPALEETAASIHEKQNSPNLTGFHIVDEAEAQAKGFIREIDTVQLYADLLDRIFRFEDMRRKAQERASSTGRPLQLMLDGMGGATGPFIREIFGRRLGLNADFFRCEPDPYLGGPNDPAHANHPEPDFNFIPDLIANNETGQYDIVAAYDSDGDRRLNGGGGVLDRIRR